MTLTALKAASPLLFAAGILAALNSSPIPSRPAIAGVAGIRVRAADLEKSLRFYGKLLGLPECHSDSTLCFRVNAGQSIELIPLGEERSPNRLVFIAFETNDSTALHQSLAAAGIPVGDRVALPDGSSYFEALDPEKHLLRFIQFPMSRPLARPTPEQISARMIHTGYVVQDRPAMDRLYKDLLGFHLYWHGGMEENVTDWVDMQVPNGTDWLEYMLNVSPNAQQDELGIMNHVALGVSSLQPAIERLRKNGWVPGEEPQIGRDGKWQLNLYDPDGTRVELMEFKPVEKPCCAEYSGPHPH